MFYDYEAENLKGESVKMDQYKGKVVLVVNTATKCGFTPQYDDLEALHEKYAGQGLCVLEFPCNQFGEQAPGSDEEIAEFCKLRFGVKYDRFKKIDVNGPTAHPLFAFLQNEVPFGGFDMDNSIAPLLDDMLKKANPNYADDPSIKWNFTKFLIDRDGNVVARFEPTADMSKVEKAVADLL